MSFQYRLAAVSAAPRPWLSRRPGECAYPVAGFGVAVMSCCNASYGKVYCPAHERAMRRPAQLSGERFEQAVLALLESRA